MTRHVGNQSGPGTQERGSVSPPPRDARCRSAANKLAGLSPPPIDRTAAPHSCTRVRTRALHTRDVCLSLLPRGGRPPPPRGDPERGRARVGPRHLGAGASPRAPTACASFRFFLSVAARRARRPLPPPTGAPRAPEASPEAARPMRGASRRGAPSRFARSAPPRIARRSRSRPPRRARSRRHDAPPDASRPSQVAPLATSATRALAGRPAAITPGFAAGAIRHISTETLRPLDSCVRSLAPHPRVARADAPLPTSRRVPWRARRSRARSISRSRPANEGPRTRPLASLSPPDHPPIRDRSRAPSHPHDPPS